MYRNTNAKTRSFLRSASRPGSKVFIGRRSAGGCKVEQRTAVRFLGKQRGKTTTRTSSSMIQRPEPAEKNAGGVHTSSRPKEKHCAGEDC